MNSYQRRQVQGRILNILDQLKNRFADSLIAAGMTLGDEFQIVMSSAEKVLDVLNFLKDELKIEVYSGVGIGSIEAFTERASPSEMYGEAFYLARNAVNEAKKKQREITFATGNEKIDFELNTILELALFIRRKWTKRQKTILSFVEASNEIRRKEIARHFNITEQAISKTIKISGFELFKRAILLIKSLLASIME
jgi:hypothetical protein